MAISLTQPSIGSTNWGGDVNNNWQTIQDALNRGGGVLTVRNETGSQLAAGPVRVTGYSAANSAFKIAAADAAGAQPAVALLLTALANNTNGTAYITGTLTGVLNTSGAAVGDPVHLAVGGGMTLSAPSGSDQIVQVVGRVRTVAASGDVEALISPPIKLGSSWLQTSPSSVVSAVAGESLAARDLVYVAVSGSYGQTAGRVYKTDADAPQSCESSWILGFATAAASAGDSVSIQVAGSLGGFSGLTAGAVYYVSSTAGAISTTSSASGPVAMALDANTIVITRLNAPLTGYYSIPQGFATPPTVTYGYFGGGSTGAVTAIADRITFSTGAVAANTVSNLSLAREALSAVSDTVTYGYFCGGYSSGGKTWVTDRITFSTGATAARTAANLTVLKYGTSGVSDASTYGYIMGGNTNATTAETDRITYSTGTTAANSVSDLSAARDYTGGVSDGGTYGYCAGGWQNIVTTDRIVFSTGVASANTASNLTVGRAHAAGLYGGSVYGYFGGGETASNQYTALTDRISFSTSVTAANTVSNLSQARSDVAAIGDGATYGYFAGGYTGASVALTDRITFSTGTTAARTASNLSGARDDLAAVADATV